MAAQRFAKVLRADLSQRAARHGVGQRLRRTDGLARTRVEAQARRYRQGTIRIGRLCHHPQGATLRCASSIRSVGS